MTRVALIPGQLPESGETSTGTTYAYDKDGNEVWLAKGKRTMTKVDYGATEVSYEYAYDNRMT
ncbi:hypothetical protein ACFL1X_09180 [Candidatus Hydrogenedentota bacterium]